MTKLVAPLNVASVTVDTEEYTPDENGVVVAKTAEHAVSLKLHGFVDYVEHLGQRIGGIVQDFAHDLGHDEAENLKKALADARAETAELRDQFAALIAEVSALKTAGVSGTESVETPKDGTSSGQDDTPAAPNLDTATRDEIVAWLKSKGVAVAANISRDTAVEVAKQNGVE